MIRSISKLRPVLSAIVLTMVAFNPVWSDDTEIFYGSTAATDASPNVMFVLDGSGSMNWWDCEGQSQPNKYGPCYTGQKSRLEILKESLKSVLDSTSDINVGLMRFSHEKSGGRVLFPIMPIDQQLCFGAPCDGEYEFNTKSKVKVSKNDAIQLANGTTRINDKHMSLMSDPVGSGSNAWVGMRFTSLSIPQGATITDARLDFTAALTQSAPTDLLFHIEEKDNAGAFSTKKNNISNRNRVFDTVEWKNVPTWESDSTYESPDLSPLVQKIVNRTGWCGEGDGQRLAHTLDSSKSKAPVLRISYTLNNVPANGGCTTNKIVKRIENARDDGTEYENTGWWSYDGEIRLDNDKYLRIKRPKKGWQVGLLFRNINLPADAEILQADLTVKTRQNSQNWGSLNVDIRADRSGNPDTFWFNYWNFSNRNKTPTTVAWNNISADHNKTSKSPSLTPIVNEILSSDSWAAGNNMAFFLEPAGGSGQRAIGSYEDGSSNTAKLTIRYKTYIRSANDVVDGPVTTVRDELLTEIDELVASGGTPSVGAMLFE